MEAQRSMAYWCRRGGLFTLVHAPNVEEAARKASRAMGRDLEGIEVRVATIRDIRLWAQLLEQDARWKEAATKPAVAPGGEQLAFVA